MSNHNYSRGVQSHLASQVILQTPLPVRLPKPCQDEVVTPLLKIRQWLPTAWTLRSKLSSVLRDSLFNRFSHSRSTVHAHITDVSVDMPASRPWLRSSTHQMLFPISLLVLTPAQTLILLQWLSSPWFSSSANQRGNLY